ncbi:M14 family metallopeptidase [Winogradskyella echinorum]|uniref:M14 family metallopeptidase n=1 Tax=Winogradskyella echinorum TaxID=538189 RepID=A0ABR6Y4K2_9FLAO|nr:M14 family metallopeptidase [Winogradskyella echinorum]MBC3847674.1 M14 family metallopeptidase [Winogradskyella echinorum]MBC5752022.1 M14 family metallopeptidase [Winogradskyella echinorum]
MKNHQLLLLLIFTIMSCSDKSNSNSNTSKDKVNIDFTTTFEKSEGLETATYKETIQYYRDLADTYSEITIQEIGETDSGKPLHLVTLNMAASGNDFEELRKDNRILLINNGIHPGESDGIDATMMLYRDIVQGKIDAPKQTVLVTIPIYNVGGSLNRNSGTRTNQNGPKEYGFRGNARNYDLNRDFIKADTKNARTFAKLFHLVQPDVFIDNHVSNGADYQYTLTHLFTQHNKLGGKLGNFIHTEMMPMLEQKLEAKSWDITPYVNVFNRTPESGFSQFMDSPRYSTGYTTLFNTLGMMVETHMLKPYKQRVEGTYELMKSMIEITEEQGDKISQLRQEQAKTWTIGKTYPLTWAIDTTQSSTLKFKGYEGVMIPSDLTGAQRLKYDTTKPFTKDVTYQNYFKPTDSVTVPKSYVIPQGWHNVIELLKLNHVEFTQIKKDTVLSVESYKIADYQTTRSAYEGHYAHYKTKVKSSIEKVTFRAGDYIVNTDQNAIRYLLETLEPTAPDSFFNWNFFDTILQQKEGFSPYVWEDKAQQLLKANPKLQIEYNVKISYDEDFANNWYAQLDWLHKQSGNYEKAHLQYPVYRIN